MKYIISIAAFAIISGCCSTPDDITMDWNISDGVWPAETSTLKPQEEGEEHFIACRADYSEQEEKELVDAIADRASALNKDILLYFHGGLSDQEDVVDGLGKQLISNVFSKEKIKQDVYPIFLNYDAGIEGTLWETFEKRARVILKTEAFNGVIEGFENTLALPEGGVKNSYPYEDLGYRAANALYRMSGDEVKKMKKGDRISSDQVEYFTELVESKQLPSEFAGKEAAPSSELEDLASRLGLTLLQASSNLKSENHNVSNDKEIPSIESLKLRVVRILVRFAIGVDHGVSATIQEEVLSAVDDYGIPIVALAKNHWDRVKKHAKQCFAKGSNGRRLIEELMELRENSEAEIYTLSHSAGSIPTAELIDYLSRREGGEIDEAVMVVPAINQQVFSDLVVSGAKGYDSLTLYMLSEKYEKSDEVFHDALYSSSLLYLVSSLAESGWMMDKMLLIDQHLKSDRVPYKYETYECVSCEEPRDVWDYVKEGRRKRLYPFDGEVYNEKAPTHSGTKCPWVSQDLARDIFRIYGVPEADQLQFEVPEEDACE